MKWVNQIGMNTLRQVTEIKKEDSSAVNDERSIISSHKHDLCPALILFPPQREHARKNEHFASKFLSGKPLNTFKKIKSCLFFKGASINAIQRAIVFIECQSTVKLKIKKCSQMARLCKIQGVLLCHYATLSHYITALIQSHYNFSVRRILKMRMSATPQFPGYPTV